MGKKNIRCNAVAPGLVLTPAALDNLNEEVRNIFLGQCATPYLGEPEDVAATIAFLASNDARYITGQTIVVDGGLTIHNPTVELSQIYPGQYILLFIIRTIGYQKVSSSLPIKPDVLSIYSLFHPLSLNILQNNSS